MSFFLRLVANLKSSWSLNKKLGLINLTAFGLIILETANCLEK